MARKTEVVSVVLGVIVGVGGIIFGVKSCTDSESLRNQVEKLQKQNDSLLIETAFLKDGIIMNARQLDELGDSLATAKDALAQQMSSGFSQREKVPTSSQEKVYSSSRPSSPTYSKDPTAIESQNSEIIASSTGGIYWVIIGYASTKEDAWAQAELVRSRGFKNAGYANPVGENPYYGIFAGARLSWDAAVKLRDLAKNTYYRQETWIWQP
ncbi:hypothetical protein KAX06_09960 [candidate division WOR-3 bacterium]|nr:hypothetical protein [candidate division WOR-3 bacterium]